jgi:DNA helicase-2/ATP-dependent DNA helicase PcrA
MTIKKNKRSSSKESKYIVKANVKHNWSIYQNNIFANIASGNGHLVVEAYAGSAKTTSIIESFKHVPRGKSILALAFNKIIQEELKSRSPSYVKDILTFHSLGYRAIKQRFGNVQLDNNKIFSLVRDQLDEGTDYDLIANICDTVAFCKYALEDTPTQIDNIIDNFGIDTCGIDRAMFIKHVINTLALDKANTNVIDFNDMCWYPFVYNLFLGQYDYVYTDESQDLNKSQLVMAKKACKSDGRIVVVGDPFQALYSWRAADTSILKEIKAQEKTTILPLPISYRCPKRIIELAKLWVPDITCPETAKEGDVIDIHLNELYRLAKPGCFILSRTNAPLIKICMQFIRNSVKANIRGRDVGIQLSSLIKKSKKKSMHDFLEWLEGWKNSEVDKLQAKNISTDGVLDRYECLINLCEEHGDLNEVRQKIDELFNDTDESNIVILSTVHRAKGLERDDVFILRWTFRNWLDQHAHYIDKPNEEMNIAYVGATRSKNRLFIVRK